MCFVYFILSIPSYRVFNIEYFTVRKFIERKFIENTINNIVGIDFRSMYSRLEFVREFFQRGKSQRYQR